VHEFLGGGPQETPQRYEATDPALLGKATAPVVIVHGDQDELVPTAMSSQYATATGARLIQLARTGHFDLIDTSSTAWPVILHVLQTLTVPRT
jgi:predicted alpha/beta hydrolase family esterase